MCSTTRIRTGAPRLAAAVSAAISAYPSIAERAKGGTSMGDATAPAATRPAASPIGARSIREIGTTASASRWRASSSEMVEVNGRITSPRRLAHEMAQLGHEQFLERQPDGRLRSRQRDDDSTSDETGAGTAQHRRRADLVVTQHAKQLAEAVEPLLQHRVHDLERRVA